MKECTFKPSTTKGSYQKLKESESTDKQRQTSYNLTSAKKRVNYIKTFNKFMTELKQKEEQKKKKLEDSKKLLKVKLKDEIKKSKPSYRGNERLENINGKSFDDVRSELREKSKKRQLDLIKSLSPSFKPTLCKKSLYFLSPSYKQSKSAQKLKEPEKDKREVFRKADLTMIQKLSAPKNRRK